MKPILFNTEMVQAILKGRKTVTRRKIDRDITNFCDVDTDGTLLNYQNCDGDFINPVDLCRYRKGDILWVRETWCYHKIGSWYGYRADGDYRDLDLRWKPSIHMPKVAARIFLKVTDARVERLQDITEEQAKKEGCEGFECDCHGMAYACTDCYNTGWLEPPELDFMFLWNSTIKKQDLDKYGWEANPWVWVIEFERVEEENE